MSEEQIRAIYRIAGEPREAAAIARAIAYEQTVELPPDFIGNPVIDEAVVGTVEAVEPDPELAGASRATVGYASMLASGQIPQLLNLLYGNVSIYSGVRLLDVQLPDAFLNRFSGPRFGVDGLRRMLGVHDRPLLATALKPRGTSVDDLARMAREFAFGGGDIVKDDQNLVDGDFEAFKRRTEACQRAVSDANA